MNDKWSGVGPDTTCEKCSGTGAYAYDENHSKICEACCSHDEGRWLLTEGFSGYRAGKKTWCCRRGCGELFDTEE